MTVLLVIHIAPLFAGLEQRATPRRISMIRPSVTASPPP
jgi:hypothetical protein